MNDSTTYCRPKCLGLLQPGSEVYLGGWGWVGWSLIKLIMNEERIKRKLNMLFIIKQSMNRIRKYYRTTKKIQIECITEKYRDIQNKQGTQKKSIENLKNK